MIEIKNLTKKYGDKLAVDNISITVKAGEIFGFIGRNGAGKTTTIKSLMGIMNYDSGDIIINGKSMKDNPIDCKMEMAYVPDNPDLYENMTAINFINFVCDMYLIDSKERRESINKYSKMFDMESHLNDDISTFSHGMKQKIALIAQLCHNPKILVLDEPFVGLDPVAVFDVKKIMKEMAKEGKIVFFSTHILDVAEKLCSTVCIIDKGKIVKTGSMKEIKGDSSLEDVFLHLGEK